MAKPLSRSTALALGGAFCALLWSGAASADPMGSIVGTVTALTGSYVNVNANHQIVHFTLPSPFFAVYNADKSRADITDISIGSTVRVSFTVDRNGQNQAREIDILGG
jgi:hypothetical protein